MVAKEMLRLGQVVLVGEARERAVVDGLTQTFAGIKLECGGGYRIADYGELYVQGQA